MSSTLDSQHDVVVEKQPARTAPPPMYQVVLLNDDYTPMEFVVKVLQKFFGKNQKKPPGSCCRSITKAVAFVVSIHAMWQPPGSRRWRSMHGLGNIPCSALWNRCSPRGGRRPIFPF